MTVDAARLVTCLRAAGEITRLRILALLAEGELSVKDFTEILGQSQPRISRHMKLLVDAGLVVRHAEGAWAFFRLADEGEGAALAAFLVGRIDADDAGFRKDQERLAEVRAARQASAAHYFAGIAESWDRERSLHVPEAAIEARIRALAGPERMELLIDLGTGTGRMLDLLAPHYRRAIGLDSSREMLAIARAKLEAGGVSGAQVRMADIGHLGDYAGLADLAVLHQVLHYFDDPLRILREARRVMVPGGRLLVVDFAPHDHDFLVREQAHRRLGLSDGEMTQWASACGLTIMARESVPELTGDGLTVCLWLMRAVQEAQS